MEKSEKAFIKLASIFGAKIPTENNDKILTQYLREKAYENKTPYAVSSLPLLAGGGIAFAGKKIKGLPSTALLLSGMGSALMGVTTAIDNKRIDRARSLVKRKNFDEIAPTEVRLQAAVAGKPIRDKK